MSRPLRIEYPGAYYHVMSRAIRGQAVFLTDDDYKGYLALLEDAWRRWDIRVFSYCLMETHYHLALQTPHGNLQRVMRHIDGVYTQRFNRAHKRDGPLFRGRYKAIVIDRDIYLAALVRYIHLNPVEAHKADDPRKYVWSSHHHYLRPNKAPQWLKIEEVMANYKSSWDFHTFVVSGNEEALVKFYSSKKLAPLLGSNDFINKIRERRASFSEEHTRYETVALRPRVSSVLRDIAKLYHVSEETLLHGKRGRRNEARQVAMYLVRELCNKSLHTIAELFSLGSYGGVGAACSVIEKQLTVDRGLRRRIEQIRKMVSKRII